MLAMLKATAGARANGIQLLRIYWYDGLLHGRLSQEQESLANTDNVKVRLGAVTAGQQKGVDSLIVTDLIELARNHAISDAVLLSGDEDLRVGVQIAQSFGVRVHLIGIEPSSANQSHLLRQEADTTGEWSKEEVSEILTVKSSPEKSLTSVSPHGNIDELLDQVVSDIFGLLGETELERISLELSRDSRWVPEDFDRRLLLEGREKIGRDLERAEMRHIRNKFKEFVTRHT